MKLLIDGDILRYRIGFASETNYHDVYMRGEREAGRIASFTYKKEMNHWVATNIGSFDDVETDTHVEPEQIENCLHSVKISIESMLEALKATDYEVYLTGKGNYRDELVGYYKANRDRSKKPIHFDVITDYLIMKYNATIVDGMEADDAMGIEQMSAVDKTQVMSKHVDMDSCMKARYANTCICTIDKDLDTIPGWHYNFVKDEKYFVTEEEAITNFYDQMLSGDTSDNIPGLYKITGTKYSKALKESLVYKNNEKDLWEHVFHIYTNAFYDMDTEDAYTDLIPDAVLAKLREIGKLLWIKRTENDDWEPPCG